jgi:diguanylate cyclase (GGDEF)-like protein
MTAYARALSQEFGIKVEAKEALTIRPARGAREEHEWTYIRKDGGRLPVFLAVTALRDEHNSLTGYLGLSYDITDRKKQQAQIAAQRDELHAANERLHALATTDALTGALNRRAFSETLDLELQRSARTGEAFSLILLDVDRFKQFNDSFGHLAGDDVLVRTAQLMRDTCRPIDIVARFGGEEFALILPATLAEGALAAAERCRQAIEKENWKHRTVTASFGVATWEAHLLTTDTPLSQRATYLIETADAALYRAKQEGRNRVCCHAAGAVKTV